MATLVEKTAELAQAKADLAKAQVVQSYGQGDRNVDRAPIAELQKQVVRLSREVDELTAKAAGAANPFVVTPSWNR